MPADQALATFKDRHTLVYERTYPHAIELVFEAVSTGEQLDAWMCPTSRVERHPGGACSFTWGGPVDGDYVEHGTVTTFDPPTTVEYTMRDGSFMRFDLSADGAAATNLRFTLHFLPNPDAPADFPGGDFPAGRDTAWQPGFCAGYHEMLDDLRALLAGSLDVAAKLHEIAHGDPSPEEQLISVYREHIRDTCPPA